MYELKVAFHYLRPRWRQLSASMISCVAVLVVALVVWLVVVFFSVTHGLQSSWLQKLVAIAAPARLTPTPAYYRSYYYLVDSASLRSDYALKTIGEKRLAEGGDPYDSTVDGQLPAEWSMPDLASDGTLKDLVKEAFGAIEALRAIRGFDNVRAYDFEMSRALLHLPVRKKGEALEITQEMFIGSLELENPALAAALLPAQVADIYRTLQEMRGSPRGDGVVLPKNFKNAGIAVGDRGWLTYDVQTASGVHEQRLPVQVIAFYDPGIIPLGGKFLLAGRHIPALMRSTQQHEEVAESNGIHITFADLSRAEEFEKHLSRQLEKRGIAPYWQLETYRHYPHAKEFLQQLGSERNLFTLLAAIIIAVACSNIVSMLIILVNDKRAEIGTLRAMGASAYSIAIIFGCCGAFIGLTGSLLGIGAALLTLRYLDSLIALLSSLQGRDLFHPLFYGEQLPTAVSGEALLFVILATGALSLVAGILPAIRTALAHPAQLLRGE